MMRDALEAAVLSDADLGGADLGIHRNTLAHWVRERRFPAPRARWQLGAGRCYGLGEIEMKNTPYQASREREAGARSDELQCRWIVWRAVSDGEVALEMPPDNCCDMRGVIRVAKSIMPHVWRIATFSGGAPDTEYRLINEMWTAFDRRPAANIGP